MSTTIEWTNETWNPVTGCSKVSPGCDNCYMFALYPRLRGMSVPGYATRPDMVTLLPERLDQPFAWRTPRMVFVNSMSDVFHRDVPDKFILDMMQTMRRSSQELGHTFQILTKRPGRAVAWWNGHAQFFPDGWPQQIWLGTSVEAQKYAPRIDVLARVPAAVRFVSAEPLLGPLDLDMWLRPGLLSWLIVGGESGPRARPMRATWARDLRDQCMETNTPFFFKQWGTYDADSHRMGKLRSGRRLDGHIWGQFPLPKHSYPNLITVPGG